MSERTPNKATRREVGSGVLARLLSTPIRIAGAVALRLAIPIGALCALSAAGLLVYSAIEGSWMIASFEAVVLTAGIFATLTGMGRFRQGPALALLCAGGAIGVVAVLAEPAMVSRFLGTAGRPLVIGGFEIMPLMIGHVIAGALLVASAALVVWSRSPARSVGYLIRSGIAGASAMVIVVLGVWHAPKGGARHGAIGILDHISALLAGLPLLVLLVLTIAAFFLVIGLVSAAGHCAIRSFEAGRQIERGSEKSRPESPDGAGTPGNPARA